MALALVWADRGESVDMDAIRNCTQPRAAAEPPVREIDGLVEVELEQISQIESAMAAEPWVDGEQLLVATRLGQIRLLAPGGSPGRVLLDIEDRLSINAEGGLLGMALSPDETHLYVHYTDVEGTSRIVELAVTPTGIDPDTERLVLSQDHPGLVHNGGAIAFGPDGFLYIGFGDGGGRIEDARRVSSVDHWDGKILRIDPRGDAAGDYKVPPDNPYAGSTEGRDEIWIRGVRNPFRFAFDPDSGDIWVGDVGEACYEELTLVAAGSTPDLGFPAFEGVHEFFGGDPDDVEFPDYVYRHGPGCAVIPGAVAASPSLPALRGWLIYSDFCEGGLRAVRRVGAGVEHVDLQVDVEGVFSFGSDARGEVLVLTGQGIFRLAPDRS